MIFLTCKVSSTWPSTNYESFLAGNVCLAAATAAATAKTAAGSAAYATAAGEAFLCYC